MVSFYILSHQSIFFNFILKKLNLSSIKSIVVDKQDMQTLKNFHSWKADVSTKAVYKKQLMNNNNHRSETSEAILKTQTIS